MPDVEAIGDAITSGVAARAVEPSAGEAQDGHTHEKNCLNCGCALVGDYCHCCGQQAHVHRTLGAFWHDLLHGVLHFEGKIWRTLPMLVWRPGELTRRYADGQRARFVSPIALFLFAVFMMFAVISLVGGPFELTGTRTPEDQERLQGQYEEERADGLREMEELRAARAALVREGKPTAEVDREISEHETGLELQKTIFESMGAPSEVGVQAERTGEGAAGGNAVTSATEQVVPTWFDQAYRTAKKNPSLLLYKVQNNAYKFSWALIPISVPFVWLLFLHRRRYRQFRAYDHTVFVTYSIAFMSLGFILLSLLRPLGLPSTIAGWAMILVPPLHMYRQLRGTYALSRWSAAWRTVALLLFSVIAAIIFMSLLLMMGVLG